MCFLLAYLLRSLFYVHGNSLIKEVRMGGSCQTAFCALEKQLYQGTC